MNAIRILRRPRVLIVGCGDVGQRCARQLLARAARPRVIALTTRPERAGELRSQGIMPIVGDLDAPRSLRRLTGLAQTVLLLAPPPSQGDDDPRTQALLAALASRTRRRAARPAMPSAGARRRSTLRVRRSLTGGIVTEAPSAAGQYPRVRIVYASTTGVYGDCGGALVDETRPVAPSNARAKRRVAAERRLRRANARGTTSACIVRIPGIYAQDRLPLARIEQRKPALREEDDVYTNHIHADDLAAIMLRAAVRGRIGRIVHASDDTVLKMGAYFDRVADAFGLARVPRITREVAESTLDPLVLSFMRESRRLSNARLKRELGVALRYRTVDDFLRSLSKRGAS
jgi:nucleoside-diphosphate-sugar epimerase